LFAESVTFTVKLTAEAAAVGVPLRTPVEAPMLSHDGSPVADHVYPVPLPPEAVRVAE
jgi:hypothetical protein